MTSLTDHRPDLPGRQPTWSKTPRPASYQTPESAGPTAMPQPLRPIEPSNTQNIPRPFLPPRVQGNDRARQLHPLPGVQEILSPSARTGVQSPVSGPWVPVNQPQGWHSERGSVSSLPRTSVPETSSSFTSSPTMTFHRQSSEAHQSRQSIFRQPSVHLPAAPAAQLRASLPGLSSMSSELMDATKRDRLQPILHPMEQLSAPFQAPTTLPFHDPFAERSLERRSSSTHLGKNNPPGANYSLQVVAQRHVPGEGMCYVFKDGSTCPTVIDGEAVNPLWGTTKAGKARKRLAQACLNCREKKIKCEPGEASCLQCEKAKRECQRPPHHLPQESQADIATGNTLALSNRSSGHEEWSSQDSTSSTIMSDGPAQKRRRSLAIEGDMKQDKATSINLAPGELKRPKSDRPMSPSKVSLDEQIRRDSKRSIFDKEDPHDSARNISPSICSSQDEDPYQLNAEAAGLFLKLFFTCSMQARLMFPQKAFTRWATTYSTKRPRECMILNAALAVGSIFAGEQFSSFGRLCADRADQAERSSYGRFSMGLVQARLLLSAYHHLNGNEGQSWELTGSALRAIVKLGFNVEPGCSYIAADNNRASFGFTREQLIECRRRTFWAAFLWDRYTGDRSASSLTIPEEDIHIRLPCAEDRYEQGLQSEAPIFMSGRNITSTTLQSPAASTIAVACLWKDVSDFTRRSATWTASAYTAQYEAFDCSLEPKFLGWQNSLPSYLRYNQDNLKQALQRNYACDFISMHVINFTTRMFAARLVRHELLSPAAVERKVRDARTSALQLLEFISHLRNAMQQDHPSEQQRSVHLLNPFTAYALQAAIDIITGRGFREDLHSMKALLTSAVASLQEYSHYCLSTRAQSAEVQKRINFLKSTTWDASNQAHISLLNTEPTWSIPESMDKTLDPAQDVIYGITNSVYFGILQVASTH